MKHQNKRIYAFASILALLLIATIQPALAEIVDMHEGTTIKREAYSLYLKKAEESQGGYCKIKVDKAKEYLITKGSTQRIKTFDVQVVEADEERCKLSITDDAHERFDVIDTLSIPAESEQTTKSYQIGGKTLVIQVSQFSGMDQSVKLKATIDAKQTEETTPLTKGGSHIFSEGSKVVLLDIPNQENVQVKVGVKMSIQQPATPPIEPEVTPVEVKEQKVEEKQVIIPKETDKPEQQPGQPKEQLSKKKSCSSDHCYVNSDLNTCLPSRTRLRINNVPSYCDLDGAIKAQKTENEPAKFSYECQSNVLKDGACLPLKKKSPLFSRMAQFMRVFG